MNPIRTIATVCFLILLMAGQVLLAQNAPFEIYADKNRKTEKGFRAEGNAELVLGTTRVHADTLELDIVSGDLTAQGRVTLTTPTSLLSGDELLFNITTMKGVMKDAQGLAAPAARFRAREVEQRNRRELVMRHMGFSVCNQRIPRWEIVSAKGRLKRDQYIEIIAGWLKVRNIPVFFFPYLRYPLPEDGRATGFLFPKLGSSRQRGTSIRTGFYWDILPNLDATLGYDYYRDLGWGGSGEVRYLFPFMEGEVSLYRFEYFEGNVLDRERGDVDTYWRIRHKQKVPLLGDGRLVVDVERPSNPGFLRVLSEDVDRYTMTRYQSSVHFTSSFEGINLGALFSKETTFYMFPGPDGKILDQTRETLKQPSLSLSVDSRKIGPLPGYFSLDVAFNRTSRRGKTYDYEDPGFQSDITVQRMTLEPSYRLSLLKLPWLSSSLKLSSVQTFYPESADPQGGEPVDESLHIQSHKVRLSLNGPSFYRIYHWGGYSLKHTVEPYVSLQVCKNPDEDLMSRVIVVDYADYPSSGEWRFGVVSRLLSKPDGSEDTPQEIMNLEISQSYYLDPELASMNRTINGEFPRYSDLKGSLRINLGKIFSLSQQITYNHYLHTTTLWDTSLTVQNPGKTLLARMGYRSYRNPYVAVASYFLNMDSLNGQIRIDLPRWPVSLEGDIYYDVTNKQMRHLSLKGVLHYQCIDFHATMVTRQLYFSGSLRNDTLFMLGLSLGKMPMASGDMGALGR